LQVLQLEVQQVVGQQVVMPLQPQQLWNRLNKPPPQPKPEQPWQEYPEQPWQEYPEQPPEQPQQLCMRAQSRSNKVGPPQQPQQLVQQTGAPQQPQLSAGTLALPLRAIARTRLYIAS